ncbi:threonine-phosphate decarboxylase [Natronomonas sp. EA1]|uniref:threonine-phosphate decarboxylase n=1 Tax=Natronomonas sp. EA1 TaxID=3421655 RepID=UPI003EB7703E
MDPRTLRTVGRVPHGSDDDPAILDFSANTNPEVPPGAERVYEKAFDRARTYPTEPPREYVAAAADFVDCREAEVVPTPGGLAAIRLAVEATCEAGDTALLPAPSFAEYAREVRLQGAVPEFVPHDELLDADPAGHALAVVCNPNNPTGECYDSEELRTFAARCRETDTVLLVDEAFLGFTEEPSLAGEAGVVVARSLTKLFGLPGLRNGYAVATGELREALGAARRTWNLGRPELDVGAHCLRQDEFVSRTRERVASERERMREALSERFEVFPSDAPFLLFDVGDREVREVVAAARAEGIAVRDATTFRGLDNHVRVAVRLPAENTRLLEVLSRV